MRDPGGVAKLTMTYFCLTSVLFFQLLRMFIDFLLPSFHKVEADIEHIATKIVLHSPLVPSFTNTNLFDYWDTWLFDY